MDLELADKVTVVTGGPRCGRREHRRLATGRFTTSEKVGTLVTLLASERLGNVTGVNYVIDGGLIKTT
jgi:NAD(P)-dependent dehydrogenase (short-subunit alcohol dehydrogenase family)